MKIQNKKIPAAENWTPLQAAFVSLFFCFVIMDTEDLFNSAAGDSQEEVGEHLSLCFFFVFWKAKTRENTFVPMFLLTNSPYPKPFI
jgi:hypothetical protein